MERGSYEKPNIYLHLPLDRIAQSPIQHGLKHFQGLNSHRFFSQFVPVPQQPHNKFFLDDMLSKSTYFHLNLPPLFLSADFLIKHPSHLSCRPSKDFIRFLKLNIPRPTGLENQDGQESSHEAFF